jgi:hypothetical protein
MALSKSNKKMTTDEKCSACILTFAFLSALGFIGAAIYFTTLIVKLDNENHKFNAFVSQSDLIQNVQYRITNCNPCINDFNLPYCNDLIANKTTGNCQSNKPANCGNTQNLNPVCKVVEIDYYNTKIVVNYTIDGNTYQKIVPNICDRYDANCNIRFVNDNPINTRIRMCYRENNPNDSHFDLDECPTKIGGAGYFVVVYGYILLLPIVICLVLIPFAIIVNLYKYGQCFPPVPPNPTNTTTELTSVTTTVPLTSNSFNITTKNNTTVV